MVVGIVIVFILIVGVVAECYHRFCVVITVVNIIVINFIIIVDIILVIVFIVFIAVNDI